MPLPLTPENVLILNDFSPGVFSAGALPSSAVPPGAAQETNTYGCISLPGGGLGPLPVRETVASTSFGHASMGGATNAVAISGIGSTFEFDSHVLFCVPSVSKYYMTRLNPATNQLELVAFKPTGAAAAVSYAEMLSYSNFPYGTDLNYGLSPVTNKASHILLGRLTIPDAAATGGHATYFEFDSVGAEFQAQYPARVVGEAFGFGQRNNAISGVPDQTKLLYTAPASLPNPLVGQLSLLGFLGGETYGVVSTGELLIVSKGRGALRISGSLEYPTITELPAVVSTGLQSMRAVPTSLGLLYAVDQRGVFVWNGSNISEFVSPQLRYDFFNRATPTHDESGGQSIQAAAWRGWAVFPNGFLFNPDTKSWWIMEDLAGTVEVVYWTNNDGKLYGIRDTVAHTNAQISPLVSYGSTKRTSYSWQSHPIPVAPHGRLVRVNDIEIRVIPSAGETQTVTVTLTNSEGTTVTETFTFLALSTQTIRLRRTTSCLGFDVIVRVQASSGSSNPAPVVDSVSLSWVEAGVFGDDLAYPPPTVPLNFLAQDTGGDVNLTWLPPAYVGVFGLTGYTMKTYSAAGVLLATDELGVVVSYLKAPLVPASYYFTLAAKTSTHTGPIATSATVLVTAREPDVPAIGALVAGVGQVTINWSVPVFNGGSALTAYEYEIRRVSDNFLLSNSATLPPGTAVTVAAGAGTAVKARVRAQNSVGWSAYSAYSNNATPT